MHEMQQLQLVDRQPARPHETAEALGVVAAAKADALDLVTHHSRPVLPSAYTEYENAHFLPSIAASTRAQ
ncbi:MULTISPECIES: hypothetical protein [Massilia]|jgi:hypothetical protein|uniref:hypothetical protein n=1 Tax=Massilia TaxID=149698 RepID=UPI001C62741F|nr:MULTISPECIES: hypothetical protein [Massilia]QYG03464.1 hypothetical protein KY496_08840 [Massilia sp. NP310]